MRNRLNKTRYFFKNYRSGATVILNEVKELVPMTRNYISVYIMANSRRTIYIGVTNDLLRRVYDHKQKLIEGYTRRYNLTKLVHHENYASMREAIAREKQLKGWLRAKKQALIEIDNPLWHDLAADWYARDPSLRSG